MIVLCSCSTTHCSAGGRVEVERSGICKVICKRMRSFFVQVKDLAGASKKSVLAMLARETGQLSSLRKRAKYAERQRWEGQKARSTEVPVTPRGVASNMQTRYAPERSQQEIPSEAEGVNDE